MSDVIIATPSPPPLPPRRKKKGKKKVEEVIVYDSQPRHAPHTSTALVRAPAVKSEQFWNGPRARVAERTAKRLTKKAPKKFNPYLATIVDPEGYPGIRYPDAYHRSTAMMTPPVQLNPYYFPVNCTTEEPGSFQIAWRPSAVHPYWEFKPTSTVTGVPTILLSNQTDRFGLFPTTPGGLDPTIQDDQMCMQSGVTYNVKAPLFWRNTDWVNDPYKVVLADGTDLFCYPLSGFAGTVRVAWFLTIPGFATLTNDTVKIDIIRGDTGALVQTQTLAATAGGQVKFENQTGLDITAALAADATIPTIGLAMGRPGLGFRVTWTSVGANIGVQPLVAVGFVPYGTGAMTAQQLALVPSDFEDINSMLRNFTLYRPVSSFAWLEYVGSDLQNAGQTAGIFYGGGESPNSSQLWDYEQIAKTPGKFMHEGEVKKGNYIIYAPQSTADTQMRKLVNAEEWSHPWMAISGYVDPAQKNALRFRGATNIEFVSKSTQWVYKQGKSNPLLISQMERVLAGQRLSMENPEHVKIVKEWIAKAVAIANRFGEFYEANKGWIIPAATGLMALAA